MSEKEVINQINQYLEKTGRKQYELAADLGAPPPTINRWLTGKTSVSKAYQMLLKQKGIIR